MVRGKTTVVDLTSDEDEDSDVLPAALPGRTAGRSNGTKTASRASSSEPVKRHTGASSGHYVTSTRSNAGSGTSAGSRAGSTSATGSSRIQTAKPSTSLPSTSLNKPSRRRENAYNEPGDQDDYDPDMDPPEPAARPPKQSTSAAAASTNPKARPRATVSPQKPVTGRKDPQLRAVMKREERENADDLDFFSRSKKAPVASKFGRAVPKGRLIQPYWFLPTEIGDAAPQLSRARRQRSPCLRMSRCHQTTVCHPSRTATMSQKTQLWISRARSEREQTIPCPTRQTIWRKLRTRSEGGADPKGRRARPKNHQTGGYRL